MAAEAGSAGPLCFSFRLYDPKNEEISFYKGIVEERLRLRLVAMGFRL